jgi:lipopolysaccharide/colanic/teichoic acid biosynthesis glycosyltransferase
MAIGLADEVAARSMSALGSLAPQAVPATAARDADYFFLKRSLDRLLAALLLIPGLPLIGLLVLLVKLTSKGPGLYSQLRVGQLGKEFTLYKIRSMCNDAESALGPTWAGISTDARVTKVGYWLRRLHLDELPQLFNVLRGEMSLVGPRPERPEFVGLLAEQIPRYMDRLAIPPGITGLAQINLPADTDVDSVRRKLSLDLEYLQTATIGLDLRILLCTLGRVVGFRGGLAAACLGLRRKVVLPPTLTTCHSHNTCGPQALSAVLLSSVNEQNLSPGSTGI